MHIQYLETNDIIMPLGAIFVISTFVFIILDPIVIYISYLVDMCT